MSQLESPALSGLVPEGSAYGFEGVVGRQLASESHAVNGQHRIEVRAVGPPLLLHFCEKRVIGMFWITISKRALDTLFYETLIYF